MPDMANITVKKADGTTDIVYTKAISSAGDKAPAVWRCNTVGSALAHRPELRLAMMDSADSRQRQARATYRYPQISTDSTTGLVSVVNTGFISFSSNMPKGMPSADVKEAVYQAANLLASALVKQSIGDDQSAPT